MTRTFFIGDSHFCYDAIIRMTARPFSNSREMDDHLIQCWNSVVQKTDVVWHLGDFAHKGDSKRYARIFSQLAGDKRLVRGNHDNDTIQKLGWTAISDLQDIVVDGRRVVLCHYPLREWPGYWRGAFHLFGHCHNKIPGGLRCYDVGVDSIGYVPLTLEQIIARMLELPDWDFRRGESTNGVD